MSRRNYNTSGLRPPWKKGESGNPKGRPAAGVALRECLNQFATKSALELSAIAKSRSTSQTKRAAAVTLLQAGEYPDMADFADFFTGKSTIAQLRAQGVDTSVVKKARRRIIRSKTGTTEIYELELHDRALAATVQLCNQTAGQPTAPIETSADMKFEIVLPKYNPLEAALSRQQSSESS